MRLSFIDFLLNRQWQQKTAGRLSKQGRNIFKFYRIHKSSLTYNTAVGGSQISDNDSCETIQGSIRAILRVFIFLDRKQTGFSASQKYGVVEGEKRLNGQDGIIKCNDFRNKNGALMIKKYRARGKLTVTYLLNKIYYPLLVIFEGVSYKHPKQMEEIMICPYCKHQNHLEIDLHADGFSADLLECSECGALLTSNHQKLETVHRPTQVFGADKVI